MHILLKICSSESNTSTELHGSDNDADESALNSSTYTASSSSDGINDGNDEEISEAEEDDELNDIFEAVSGR